ncbi:MAG: GvpL/GvpF family gas vesicle protein [Gemmatimonadaceae bacterium]
MALHDVTPPGALALYGVALIEADSVPFAAGTQLITLRELAAIVAPRAYQAVPVSERDVAPYREVIETVFSQAPVLPAPLGVVFRSKDALLRWLELHYHSLAEALAFVDDRLAARVHVLRRARGDVPRTSDDDAEDADVDATAVAIESLRSIRQAAAAQAALAEPPREGLVVSAAFLIERDRWSAFDAAVAAERQRRPTLRFEHSGPWPPYDFVRMQFGS